MNSREDFSEQSDQGDDEQLQSGMLEGEFVPLNEYVSHIQKRKRRYWLHILLFVLTLLATTCAGAEWIFGERSFVGWAFDADNNFVGFVSGGLGWKEFILGFAYSLPFLGSLTFHEFGHFFAAKYHHIRASLPYYIPMWLGFLGMPSTIGSMGAFIRIESPFTSRKSLFDVGVAGPLAGFVIALGVLWYGFATLPPPEYILETVHPSWQKYGLNYPDYVYKDLPEGSNLELGTTLLFEFFKMHVASNPEYVPNNREIFHYPWLLAGYLALFFTALNLLPMGQLDGGHAIYALVGKKWHRHVSLTVFTLFVGYAGLGVIDPFAAISDILLYGGLYLFFLFVIYLKNVNKRFDAILFALGVFAVQLLIGSIYPNLKGYQGWLFFAFILGRVLGLGHPPTYDERPLNPARIVLGVITFIVFALCFSPQPFLIY